MATPYVFIAQINKYSPRSAVHLPPPPPVSSHLSPLEVLSPSNLRFNQVIAVDGGGNSHFWQAAANELKHGHLGCGILHGHTVRTQAQIRPAAVDLLSCWIVQVAIYDLL